MRVVSHYAVNGASPDQNGACASQTEIDSELLETIKPEVLHASLDRLSLAVADVASSA